ncbi:hypothetical protein [Vibrio vulnificus]|uniref:hypothetical protein n=1 Tax=Vibrio vulnificus TaxID=672 RepID=UPI000D3E96B7|nr:hypothetical protein [Vibrio vulnificus]MBN8141613.1 hypothetical protein [Vibrio vulnificus]MBN8150903.1 hypothetical protein [Vibrio vulnificus]NIG90204.1 hypothetical protein [Vibrio vulnificus]PUZ81486.1 hypothetical protein DC357_13690 [Vibrio vulnificus]
MSQNGSSTGGNPPPFNSGTTVDYYSQQSNITARPTEASSSGMSWEAIGVIISILIGGVTTYFITMQSVKDAIAENDKDLALLVQSFERNGRDFEKIETDFDKTKIGQENINRELILIKYRIEELEKVKKQTK